MHGAPQNNSGPVIQQIIADTLDRDQILPRLAEFKKRSKPLRILANILFAYLFVLAPVVVWQYRFEYFGWALLIGLFAQTVTIAILFRRSHKAMLPLADEERFTHFLIMLMAPPTAIRAHDVLARHLLENFHPLAVARELCPSKTFKKFARAVLVDLRFPMLPVCPSNQANTVATEEWFRSALLDTVEKFVASAELSTSELTAPALAADAENRSYCPRCEAQFITLGGVCVDCGGRPLKPFLSPRSEPARELMPKTP